MQRDDIKTPAEGGDRSPAGDVLFPAFQTAVPGHARLKVHAGSVFSCPHSVFRSCETTTEKTKWTVHRFKCRSKLCKVWRLFPDLCGVHVSGAVWRGGLAACQFRGKNFLLRNVTNMKGAFRNVFFLERVRD